MGQDVFYDEGELRAWVKDKSSDSAIWIEPSMGSTFGVPDCFLMFGGTAMTAWFELKVGSLKSGGLFYEVRPKQRNLIRRMLAKKQRVCLIIAIKKTNDVLVVLPTQDACFGRIEDVAKAIEQGWAVMLTSPQTLINSFDTEYGIMSVACEFSILCDTWTRKWFTPGLISSNGPNT